MTSGTLSSDDTPVSPSSPSAPTGKAAPAPPKVTQPNDGVELKDMRSGSDGAKASLPIEEDIMQLARLGEIGAMQKLFDSKKYNAKYKDEEGITPLHVCLCLLFRGPTSSRAVGFVY